MKITIYSTTTCPYCGMLKNFLKENGAEFVEKLVDQDMEARKEMIDKSDGYLGVPFVVIEKAGQEYKIIGFNKTKLESILAS